MAGRKQHFIPQALQRGFGVVVGKATRVYVFKKGMEPYRSSTEGVAAQRDFYSEPSNEESLDDKITNYENSVLAPAIAAMREAPAGVIDSQLAAAAVVHLSIRSAFVRGSFSAAAIEILDHFATAMRGDESARTLLEVDSISSESMLVKSIKENILGQFESAPESGRNALEKMVHFRVREKLPQTLPDIAASVLQQVGMLLEKIPELIVDGHEKALKKDLAPPLRVERLKAMRWQIIAVEQPTHFVLPDCLAVGAKTSDFREMEPYSLLSDDELAGVVMPICSSKVLVGCFGNLNLDIESLNRAFAKCSLDFFISSQDDQQTAEAAQLIGSAVSKYVGSLAEEDAFSAPERIAIVGESSEAESQTHEVINVPIKFEPSGRKSGKAQAALRRLLSEPELQMGLLTVETIIVADDVLRSLRQRGVAVNDYLAQIVRFGTCLPTETSEKVSSQIFVTTEVVNRVVKKHPLASAATAKIRHLAGQATCYAAIAKIPKEVLQRPRSLLGQVELRIALFVCTHYFGGRLSQIGHISDEELAAADNSYSQTLVNCVQEIDNARCHFIAHRDFDAAFGRAIMQVEQLLYATANACASTGSEVSRWKASNSLKTLRTVSLGDWFELFARDLKRLFDSRERLEGDDELVLLGSHVERVLWSLGIVLSTRTPEQIWMDVLTDEQLVDIRRKLMD